MVQVALIASLALLAIVAVPATQAAPSVKIAAFNIQIFGRAKAKKTEVMNTLTKIILRYDLILVQEIRDSSGRAFRKLMAQVRLVNPNMGYVLSRRLGRTRSKEQYAYIYNKTSMDLQSTHQYDKLRVLDTFERPPFCANFRIINSDVEYDFVAIGVHIKPGAAVAELNNMPSVYDQVVTKFKTKNVIMMGDFNADCTYVGEDDWESISLWTNTTFSWLIGSVADTTLQSTNCAYDRFVVAGEEMSRAVVINSADIFNFTTAYGLSYTASLAVSDHYPIELELTDEVVTVRPYLSLSSSKHATEDAVMLSAYGSAAGLAGFTFTTLTDTVDLTADVGCDNIVTALSTLQNNHPGLLSAQLVGVVDRYRGLFGDSVLGWTEVDGMCRVKISYDKAEPLTKPYTLSVYQCTQRGQSCLSTP